MSNTKSVKGLKLCFNGVELTFSRYRSIIFRFYFVKVPGKSLIFNLKAKILISLEHLWYYTHVVIFLDYKRLWVHKRKVQSTQYIAIVTKTMANSKLPCIFFILTTFKNLINAKGGLRYILNERSFHFSKKISIELKSLYFIIANGCQLVNNIVWRLGRCFGGFFSNRYKITKIDTN